MPLYDVPTATENETLINNTGMDGIKTAMLSDNPVNGIISSAINGTFGSYADIIVTVLIGYVFYLIYQDHRKPVIPALIAILFGGVIFSLIPDSVANYIIVLVIMAVAGIITKMYMDKR